MVCSSLILLLLKCLLDFTFSSTLEINRIQAAIESHWQLNLLCTDLGLRFGFAFCAARFSFLLFSQHS